MRDSDFPTASFGAGFQWERLGICGGGVMSCWAGNWEGLEEWTDSQCKPASGILQALQRVQNQDKNCFCGDCQGQTKLLSKCTLE